MKLQILSDLHLEFGSSPDVFSEKHIVGDVLVLAGDTHVNPDLLNKFLLSVNKVPIVLVLGNHEFYGHDFLTVRKEYLALSNPKENIYVLDNKKVVLPNFPEVTFLGATLWTSLEDSLVELSVIKNAMNDYRLIREGREPITPSVTQREFRKSLTFLEKELKKTKGKKVVITHHLPSFRSIPPKYIGNTLNPAYASNLDTLIFQTKPEVWIHGHTHASMSYYLGETQVVCNPFGYFEYEENLSFKPSLCIGV